MNIDKAFLKEAFLLHTNDPIKKLDQFWYLGKRYIQCDKCGEIVATEDCQYYGGEGERMFKGGCRQCFGNNLKMMTPPKGVDIISVS